MNKQKRAVVIGGSVAGLCAARALSDHFQEVVLLERDRLLPDVIHRRGTPQSRHPHFLLNAGRRAIEELYPGFGRRLLAAGGLELNPARDAAFCEPRGWAPRKRGAMTMLYSSRVLLERVLREMALETPNIEIREGARAAGLGVEQQSIALGTLAFLLACPVLLPRGARPDR